MNYFWSLLCFLFTSSLIAQTNVKGQVIDFDSAIPIAFASITYNSTSISADWEGKFNLTVEDPKLPIKINYPGYLEKIAYPPAVSSIITVKLIRNINSKKKEIYSEIEVNNIIKKVIFYYD